MSGGIKKKLILSTAISAAAVFGLLAGCGRQEETPKTEISTVVQSTESETEKADLSTYVDDVLVPQYGQCNTGKYECEYVVNSNGGAAVDSVHSEKGILNWNVDDYDGDGTEELLVLILDNQAKIQYDPIARNSISLQMYAEEDGSIELKDTYDGLCPVLGYGDKENDGIFLKESDNKIYICGSTWNTIKNYATGIIAQSFILIYEGGRFMVQAGQTESISGSEFSECADTVSQMADILRKIGLEKEADQLYVPAFQFNDSVDLTLMRIIGENKGFKEDYFTSYNAEDLGKVELTLTCSDIEDEKGEEESEPESESEKASDYILPDSDSRYLTDSEVRGLSANELMLARNEIYARHGRKFKDSGLQDYFNSKSWYRGTVDPDDFSMDVFNEYENKNLELIQKYEN